MMNPTPTGEAGEPAEKKFQNGWTPEVEVLMAEWADKAACYRWMHEKTEREYNSYNQYFTIPVIILSTLTGTANFGLNSMVPDAESQKYAQAIIGGVSLLTGIISTVANFLRYAQGSEANRSAGISWGKFQRLIAIELSLNPDERSDCMHFLKMCRTELDRLIEQSPAIPTNVILEFKKEFSKFPDVRKPEIAGEIHHTNIFDGKDERMVRQAADTALILQTRQGVVKQMVMDDLDSRIQTLVTAAVRNKKGTPLGPTTLQKGLDERKAEIEKVAMGGVVRAMKERLLASNQTIGPAPQGIGKNIGVVDLPTHNMDTDSPIILHVEDTDTDISGSVMSDDLPGQIDVEKQ
jgi:hypothetical protein